MALETNDTPNRVVVDKRDQSKIIVQEQITHIEIAQGGPQGIAGPAGAAGAAGPKGTYTVSETAPASPSVGDTWFNSTTSQMYIRYDGYWVETSSSYLGPTGPTGATGPTGPAGTSFTGYDYEIHVSQVDGNDTTGNGDLLTPVATITKALTLVGSQRKTIIVHPGTYTESPSITVQYTTITGPGLIGGNIVISGTVSTNKGCTIAGIKMTNLTVTAPSGTGNVNILNCEISGTFTKSSNADYTVLRLCDLTAASITGAGLVAIFGGNPNFITVNNASANVIVKSAVTVAPVLTAGTLSLVDSVVAAAVTNAVTSAASSVITLANCQFLASTLTTVAPVVLNGFYSILNCVFDKPNSTLVASSGTGGTTNSIDYFQYINANKFITQGGTSAQYVKGDGSLDSSGPAGGNGETTRYSPTFTATGLTFTGTGATYPTYNSYYVKNGRLVSFVIEVDCTTVTNFGTGQYKLQLPFTPAVGFNHFSGWAWADPNIDPDTGTGHTILNCDTAGITNVLDLHYLKQSGGANSPIREGLFVQGTPVTLTTISKIYVNGTYIAEAV